MRKYGHEDNHKVMRARVAVELALNEDFYLNDAMLDATRRGPHSWRS
jgi:hypothetical protein